MIRALLLAFAFVVPVGVWSAADRTRSADEAAIRRILQVYLDGHATGKRGVLAGAFHPDARLSWMREGAYTTRTLEEYLQGFPGKPAEDEAQWRRRIVSVDVAGTAAVAKLELDHPARRITDYMTLLETSDGEWRIVHKSFDIEPRTP
ncbi:MAG TPA: nuclear transport factor 2 family protein [Gemmatimonadota bacterium]